ncbi:MAG: uncharacterized protein JWO86_846 [Myxococcaceae bacterium]|nr:uncharacterized protein [Myxococcaceae bacterium]
MVGDGASGFADAQAHTSCDASAARKSPLGCEYVVFTVRRYHQDWACQAIIISNPGIEPARLSLEHDHKPLDLAMSARLITAAGSDPGYQPLVDDTVPPGASAVVALIQGNPSSTGLGRCAIPPIFQAAVGVDSDETAPAFRLVSSAPVFVTQHFAYATQLDSLIGGATSLRARGSWGSSHLDVGVYEPGRPPVQTNQSEASFDESVYDFAAFAATATVEDNTHFAIVTDSGMTDVTLAAGEVHRTRRDDLFIGSRIESDHPVAFLVGSPDSFIPYNVGTAQPLLMPVAPTTSWGHEYAVVRYPDRYPGTVESPPHRIVASSDGTVLTYDPTAPAGAPASMNAGELAVFGASSPFVVRSQDDAHRFHVSVMMTGSETVMPDDERARDLQGRGSPNLVAVPPPEEFASRFAFATDHSYPDAQLVLVRKKTGGVFADVKLDCAGTLEGWRAIDAGGEYQTVTVALSAGAFEAQVYPGGSCSNGPHVLASQGLVSGYIWGWGHAGAHVEEPTANSAASYVTVLYGLPPEEKTGAK